MAGPAIALATLAISFSAILIRMAQTDYATVVALRMGMAVLLLVPLIVRERRHGERATRTAFASGVLLAVHFLAWTASLAYTSVAASVLLVCLHPLVVTPLSARLLGDRVTARVWAGIALALCGTVITTGGDLGGGGRALFGDGLALLGALALAAYLLIGRAVRATQGVAQYSAAAYATVAVIAGVIATGRGFPPLSPRILLACLGLAAVCTVGGHTVFNWALRHVPAGVVSVAFLGEPPLTTLLAFVLLSQIPAASTVTGGVLILTGVGLTLAGGRAEAGRIAARAPG